MRAAIMWPLSRREITVNVSVDPVVVECLKSIASDAERTADAIEELDELRTGVNGLLRVWQTIDRKVSDIMATLAEFEAKFAELDAATTAIANDLAALKDLVANNGLPANIEADILATLSAKVDALKALASVPPA